MALSPFPTLASLGGMFTTKKKPPGLLVPPGRGSAALAGGPASYARPSAPRPPAAPAARPPATPGAPGTPGAGATPPPPARQTVDYSADPILAQIRLLGQQSVPDALAGADAARKQALIQFGDPSLARSTVFGGKGFSLPGIAGGPAFTIADTRHTGDESTAAAAQQNPFSILARLLHSHGLNQQNIDDSSVDAGLYASGYRVKQLNEEQRGYQQDQADAYSTLAQALGQIDTQIQGAYTAEGDRQMQADKEAFLRAVAAAAQNPGGTSDTSAPAGAPPPAAAAPGTNVYRGLDPGIAAALGNRAASIPVAIPKPPPERKPKAKAPAKPAVKKPAPAPKAKTLPYLGRH